LWIPEGFAHGFAVTGDGAEVLYKTTDYWAPEHERCLLWNDVSLAIDWPLKGAPLMSDKDKSGMSLAACEVFA
jgi:dTDP-4-dehydrorhamnose 3,5-epimerase